MINENNFYNMCDIIEDIEPEVLEGYYPTVTELIAHRVEENVEKYLPLLLMFASNPFKNKFDDNTEEKKEYDAAVKYIQEIVSNINLTVF